MTESERNQIKELIERLVDSWNRDDMDAFVSLFTADATYVSGAGVLLKGSEAIRNGLSNQKESSGENDTVVVTDVTVNLVKSGVALAHSTWEMQGERTDETLQSRKGIFTLVATRDHERWRIAALQNTERTQ